MKKRKKDFSSIPARAVVFARVSSREQERGDSIAAQLKTVYDYCDREGIPILKEYAITESSTKTKIKNNGTLSREESRKKFYEMLDFVKKQNGKIIIVANTIDRIQRRFHEYIELDILRLANRIEIHFIRENLKIAQKSNSFEIGVWAQGVLWAQQYTMQSSDNIKRANDESRNKGRWLHKGPIGYENYKDETGLSLVRIDPVKAPIVKRIFEEYATGNYTLRKMAHFAHSLGLKTGRGGQITKNVIDYMIRNTFYYGIMKNTDVLRPHMCGNIISKELFDRVQNVLEGTCKPSFTQQSHTFALNGLFTCGTCGSQMTSERHTKSSGKEYVYLRCNRSHGDCKQGIVNEKVIFEQLEKEIFQKLSVDDDTLKDIKKEVKKSIEKEKEEALLIKKQTEQQLAEIEFMKSRYVDLLVKGTLSEDLYKQKITETTQKEIEIKELLKSRSLIDDEINEMVDSVVDFIGNAGFYFRSSGPSEKQHFLKVILSNSTVNGISACFNLKKPFNELIKQPACPIWWV